MANVALGGNPITVAGNFPKKGDTVSDFRPHRQGINGPGPEGFFRQAQGAPLRAGSRDQAGIQLRRGTGYLGVADIVFTNCADNGNGKRSTIHV